MNRYKLSRRTHHRFFGNRQDIIKITTIRWALKANYFLKNGVFLNDGDIKNILAKKDSLKSARRIDLKLVAYQELSDYLAFVNYNNKVYLIKADPIGK